MRSSTFGPPPSQPVCVTGATGFIGSQICAQLLELGYRVRGTVRSLRQNRNAERLEALRGAERFELVEADLLVDGSFDAAFAGCAFVVHTASAFVCQARDPERDLVRPGVAGTRNVLASCARASVRRVVFTSTLAAVSDGPNDRLLTETDWNTRSSLARNPYAFSKTLAEREAWKFVAETPAPFDLVVINPGLVIGPSQLPALSPANQLLVDLLDGMYQDVKGLTWSLVDVRDVATAHVAAITTPGASGRYICTSPRISTRALSGLLGTSTPRTPRHSLRCAAGDLALRRASYFQPRGIGTHLRAHVGDTPRYDATKIHEELGLTFRSLDGTVRDTLADLWRWQYLVAAAA